ncbi:MAG: helicase-exonuclease AddAB subunit AddA [Lachnospiraceae bacterium]|nr:helicase-exonuclease AddAB subunit AddA [Lachnospiraceae bacterium]
MEWTDAQKQVIQLHHRDLLVSAAAGSGKTAVLVERIIQMVTDEKHPMDIDRILVVTFTRAAAKEMKERIYKAIAKKAEEQPQNHHLARQMTLIHNAQITTIDSFCNSLVRQHFGEIDLDPEYRIADEGEMALLSSQVWDEIMEANYEAQNQSFLHLVNCYASRDRDDALVENLHKIYRVSQAYPWPREWLEGLLSPYEISSEEELLASAWMQELTATIRGALEYQMQAAEVLLADLRACAGADHHPYEDNVLADMAIISHLLEGETYQDIYQQQESMPEFSRLSTKKFERQSEEEKKDFKDRRDAIKKAVLGIVEDYLKKPSAEVFQEMQDVKPVITEMIRLVGLFMDQIDAKKRSLGVWEFADIEHFALDVLVDKATKELRSVAKELASFYEEIMVDEYQDSNHLQESILHSITKESLGAHNYFMVGDVKQSIYRFRQAEPQIFNEKYLRFAPTEASQQRIDLDANFRSRQNIINAVNDVFRYIMKPDMGGVDYDEAASLKYGAGAFYPETTADLTTEIHIIQKDDPDLEENDIAAEEAEYVFIAQRVHELVTSGMEVYDKDANAMRPITYRDIAVLRRGLSHGVGERLVEVLDAYQIPAHLQNSTGYFNSMEVEVVLSFLQILDNPRQDIPMASVLRSPMVGLSDDDLAQIRQAYPDVVFAQGAFAYGEEHREEAHWARFFELYEDLRDRTADTPIHRLIQILYEKSGYLRYVSALPAGETRRGNLLKLVDIAIAYEATSYQGLFHFVNYIQKLKKYEVDYGEADLISEEDNAVRVMTIHKSKGLEFPVVFLSGATKGFNTSDMKGDVLLQNELGIGLSRINPDKRVKEKTLYRNVMANRIQLDTLGEELRVLYVALTRAREKLIITGMLDTSALEKVEQRSVGFGESLEARKAAKGYFDWLAPAILHNPGKYAIHVVDGESLVSGAVVAGCEDAMQLQELLECKAQAQEDYVSDIVAGFQHTYRHPQLRGYKNKYSVSELKHLAIEEALSDGLLPAHNDDEGMPLFGTEQKERIVPSFLSSKETKKEYIGALRGTAMHRYLECFDFVRDGAADSYERQLEEMLASGKVTSDQKELLREGSLVKFLHSDLASRMMTAALQGKLYKERAFVMGDTPGHFLEDIQTDATDSMILVQGIIDVFFKEEDGIVLLDYKTDRVDTAEELVVRYRRQMELYADAIMRTQGMPVKEMYLYSFALGETIYVDEGGKYETGR